MTLQQPVIVTAWIHDAVENCIEHFPIDDLHALHQGLDGLAQELHQQASDIRMQLHMTTEDSLT